MTTSTPRRRKRPNSNPNPNSPNQNQNQNHNHNTPISSSSTITSLISEIEPPSNLLPSKSDFLKLLLVVTIAAAVAAVCTLLSAVVNRPPKPFCDSNLVDFEFSLSDSCEPCPSNGRCNNGELECIQGYRKYGKFCIEDGVIYETAKKLSEWTKDRLCKECADSMCDGTGAIWVCEDNLKNMLDEYGWSRGFSVNDAKYLFVAQRAMEDISEFVESRTITDGTKEFKCPDILAESYKSIACRAEQWIAKHFLALITIFALLAGGILLLMRIRRRWVLTTRADHLYQQVCDILEDNALMFKSGSDREPWLVASRLRDHLLSTKERKHTLLWKMVEDLVESDSRIDRYPKLVKGEMKVVWEWQVEGSLSSSRRKKLEGSHIKSEMKNLSDRKQRSVEIALDYNELQHM